MKTLILVLGVAFFSITSTATEKNTNLPEGTPTCFQTCNATGQIFQELYGWTAIQFGTWVVGCTNACEAQND